jgi:hypothetical protein
VDLLITPTELHAQPTDVAETLVSFRGLIALLPTMNSPKPVSADTDGMLDPHPEGFTSKLGLPRTAHIFLVLHSLAHLPAPFDRTLRSLLTADPLAYILFAGRPAEEEGATSSAGEKAWRPLLLTRLALPESAAARILFIESQGSLYCSPPFLVHAAPQNRSIYFRRFTPYWTHTPPPPQCFPLCGCFPLACRLSPGLECTPGDDSLSPSTLPSV